MSDIIDFHDLDDDRKAQLKAVASNGRRGTYGVGYGRPGAAKYVVKAWNEISSKIFRDS